MKIGICADVDKVIKLKEGTADFVELRLCDLYNLPDEEIDKKVKQLKDYGTPAEAANAFYPGGVKLCGPLYDKNAVSEYTKRALSIAAKFDTHLCVVGSGRSRLVGENEKYEDCVKQFEEVMYMVGDLSKEHDIITVIEPLNTKIPNIISTVAEGAQVCKNINHPNILLLADIYHMSLEKEPYENIAAYSDILKHIHIARPDSRIYPNAEDGFDYSYIKAIIDKAGYDLRISIEATDPENSIATAENSLNFLKSVFC